MNSHENFRQAVHRLADVREKMVEANRSQLAAEQAVDRAKKSLAEALRDVSSSEPILYLGYKYEMVGVGMTVSRMEMVIVEEEPTP